MIKIERFHICVSGNVQGVGFRYFVYYNATKLYITGWVKNLDNGDVEMEIQGKSENLRTLIEQIKKGPAYAIVKNIEIKEIYAKKEKSFKIAN